MMNEAVDGRERHGGVREDPVPFAERLRRAISRIEVHPADASAG